MLPYLRFRLLDLPDASAYAGATGEYLPGYATYAEYNYLRGGTAARVKAAHFEAALRITSSRFGQANVIDFGCADGVFLPSLSRYFPAVLGVDRDPRLIEAAETEVKNLGLENVTLVCSDGLAFDELRDRLGPAQYQVLFLLETLEHIGEQGRLYESRVDFVEQLLGLIVPDGVIIVSVPTMVGIPFLLQRAALAALRLHRDPISKQAFMDAAFRRDTSRLEPDWTPETHLGFNHDLLLAELRRRVTVIEHRSLFFSEVFVLRRR